MRRGAGFLSLLIGSTAFGATLEVDLREGDRATVELASPVDDAHLANPVGYFPPEKPAARVVRRITVENIGPVPVRNPDVRINGAPLLPVGDPLQTLGVSDPRDLLGLFAKWRDRAIHATTDLEANENPFALLHVFGAGFCGDYTRALAAITAMLGAEARFARLNGHSVIEHRLGGDWMLLDGDQNLFYLGWDNQTPVSEDDILADPLLALRTQVFGRLASWELAAAWQNTSRFEFVEASRSQKRFHLKHAPSPPPWSLFPREKLVIDLARTPDRIGAAREELRANPALRAVTCVAEFHSARPAGDKLALPYPPIDRPAGEPIYEASTEKVVACQATLAQFPSLRTGKNLVEMKGSGRIRLTFDIDAIDRTPVSPPVVRGGKLHFHFEAEGADRLWWQLAATSDFHLVPPNFDRVTAFASDLTLSSPIDQTFLSPGEHFLRAKIRRDGVWSDWSPPLRIQTDKPPQPRAVQLEGADGDQMRIRWKPGQGEMLVFGSARLDFLPEVYGGIEVTRMENGAVRESRPNRNLLATVPAKDGEAYVPVRSCYRLIARDQGLLSVPSPLARTPTAPLARVLQTRHEKTGGAITGRDVAVEMEIK